jgi:prephenate dehydrogenase
MDWPQPVSPAGTSRIGTLAVVGVGLIGGSLALALRKAGAVGRVIGVGRGRANLEVALARGIVDQALGSEERWQPVVGAADLILVATPVAQIGPVLAAMASELAPGAVVTDAGSTKHDVVGAARTALGERFGRFVPGHPIAGTEESGAESAFAETDSDAVERVTGAWRAAGARVRHLASDVHDRVLAAVSHLPHLLAFGLVSELAARPDAETYFELAASGFRDFTRIASSHPEMWRDICMANRGALLEELDRYAGELARMREALASADARTLEAVFASARSARNAWLRAHREASAG